MGAKTSKIPPTDSRIESIVLLGTILRILLFVIMNKGGRHSSKTLLFIQPAQWTCCESEPEETQIAQGRYGRDGFDA
jgi:hypothetical protein